MNYKEELERLNTLFVKEKYWEILRNVSWIFEIALKDLYRQQIEFFNRNIDNEILSK